MIITNYYLLIITIVSDWVLRDEQPNHPVDVPDDELLRRLYHDAIVMLPVAALDLPVGSYHCTHHPNPTLLQVLVKSLSMK